MQKDTDGKTNMSNDRQTERDRDRRTERGGEGELSCPFSTHGGQFGLKWRAVMYTEWEPRGLGACTGSGNAVFKARGSDACTGGGNAMFKASVVSPVQRVPNPSTLCF